MKATDPVPRFWSKVGFSGECWTWLAALDSGGYGEFSINGRSKGAHIFAWELQRGPVPKEMRVCHVCDNPACVRNDDEGWYELNGVLYPRHGHLWLGTVHDNNADRRAKGRYATGADSWFSQNREKVSGDQHWTAKRPELIRRGARHARSKLTDVQREEICQRFMNGETNAVKLGLAYSVSHDVILHVIKVGVAW